MSISGSSDSTGSTFKRQISGRDSWNSSRRWMNSKKGPEKSLRQMEGLNIGENGVVMKKRVMVVVDQTTRTRNAMMWALSHVVNKGDVFTLLHIISPRHGSTNGSSFSQTSYHVANSLGTLCKACKPEVEVEALVVQGPKLSTVLSQVKKLEVSVLVLGQKKASPLNCLIRSSTEEFVDQCISCAECLTLAVRKQSRGIGGYLISTRWQKNFWLLA